jgi:hypothetical protein
MFGRAWLFTTLGFSLSICSVQCISFSGKKLHSGEQKEKNDQNKKKYELQPKRKFSLPGNRSLVV